MVFIVMCIPIKTSLFSIRTLQITLHGEMATSSYIKASGGTCVPGRDVPTHSKGLNFLPLLGRVLSLYCECRVQDSRAKWLLSSSRHSDFPDSSPWNSEFFCFGCLFSSSNAHLWDLKKASNNLRVKAVI